jgi:hypothetical protein
MKNNGAGVHCMVKKFTKEEFAEKMGLGGAHFESWCSSQKINDLHNGLFGKRIPSEIATPFK